MIVAVDLPLNNYALLLNSPNQTFIPNVGGSAGNLCVGPDLGRHSKQLQYTGGTSMASVRVDLTALPRPDGGPYTVLPGDAWNFQVWYRDPGAPCGGSLRTLICPGA